MAGEPKNQPPFTTPVNPTYDPTMSQGIARPVDTAGVATAATAGIAKPSSGPGITSVMTPDQITNLATSNVDNELTSQIQPLQSQLNTIGGSETTALGDLGSMFGNILPYAQASAQRVGAAYDDAEQQQQNIFTAAQIQLNNLKQQQAQKAQALAQQIGGPVSIDEFTSQLPEDQQSLVNQGAGQMLHTLAYGMADVSEANAFSGQVLPLVQTEQTAKLRDYFENQKKTIQDQITSLQGQRGAMIDKAKNDLLVQERQYALDKANHALDVLKEQHNWQATQQTIKDDQKRLTMAQTAQNASIAATNARTALAKSTLTWQEKRDAQQMGLTATEYALRAKQLQSATAYNQQRLHLAQQQQWGQMLDQALSPTPGKTVTTTVKVPVDKLAAYKDHSAYKDGTSPTGFSKLVKVVQTPVRSPITDPNQLTDYLVAHGVPRTNAINMVRAREGIPNWQYGQRDPRAPKPASRKPAGGNVTNRNVATPKGNVYTTIPGDTSASRR